MELNNHCFTFAPLDWSLLLARMDFGAVQFGRRAYCCKKIGRGSWILDYVLVSCVYPTVALRVELVAGVKVSN